MYRMYMRKIQTIAPTVIITHFCKNRNTSFKKF